MLKTSIYTPYKKHYTPDWFMLNLFFFKILLVKLNERAYGRFLVEFATALKVASKLDCFVYIFPVSKSAKQSRVNDVVLELQSKDVKRIKNTKAIDALLKKLWIFLIKYIRPISSKLFYRFFRKCEESPKTYRRLLLKDPVQLFLPQSLERQAQSIIERENFQNFDKVVSFNFRESNHGVELNYNNEEFKRASRRNGAFESYKLSLKHLVNEGFLVVRTGDSTSTPIDIDGIVDLTKLNLPDRRLLEVYFLLRSHFFIAGDSGAFFLYVLLGIPCALINMSHWLQYPLRSKDLMLLKRVVDIEKNSELNLLDMFSPEYSESKLDLNRFDYIDNTESEILDSIKEMIEICSTNICLNKNQKMFLNIAESVALSIESKSDINPKAARDFLKWGSENGFLGCGRISKVNFNRIDWS